ncbi:MAG TPA: HNH endonuclease [Bacteroidales bacterium]|nr:HNH endonuclease [Bacteroidales bacterium]
MKKGQLLWNREELILAINLYCKLPFGKLHRNNPEIIKLAQLINRSPNSVAYKLVNFASLDPSLKARGIKGASNASRLDSEIWNEFYNNWEILPYESEMLKASIYHTSIEKENYIDENDLPKEGKIREQIIKARVNQNFFRRSILSSYNYTCCVTGIQQSEFLVASHIRPWGLDEKNRLNPRNGIAINALHDKAFENGFLTITPDFQIKISSILLKQSINPSINRYFFSYHNCYIILPSRFLPDTEFLKYHNQERFKP